MPWGINIFGKRDNQDQKKADSSKSPQTKRTVNPSSPSTSRVTKTRAASRGSHDKSAKAIQKAIDLSSAAEFPPLPSQKNSGGSLLFGTDPSNLVSVQKSQTKPGIPQLSPEELAIQQRDALQAAIAARKAQEERDDELRLASIRRVDPKVTPNSDAFQTILYSIRQHLNQPNSTVNELLQARFSPEDRDLLQPADWERNPALAELQGKNAEVYELLVRGEIPGWAKPSSKGNSSKKGKGKKREDKGWGKEANLAFKLTCLYFGLPIAPMGWEQSDTKKWWEKVKKVGSTVTMMGPGYDEVEDDMGNMVMRPREDPIKFLNCYTDRVYEKDIIRGELLTTRDENGDMMLT